jgi:hypothetical protein
MFLSHLASQYDFSPLSTTSGQSQRALSLVGFHTNCRNLSKHAYYSEERKSLFLMSEYMTASQAENPQDQNNSFGHHANIDGHRRGV